MSTEKPEVTATRLALAAAFDELLVFERSRTGITPEPPICSFCGRGSNEVQRMLAGFHSAHICNECVMLAHQVLTEESSLAPPRI
jgi:hypothetical protein